MAVIAFVSAKGSPGVTTSALALALTWPRTVVLAEADPAGGDLAAGYLADNEPAGGGLLGLALALRRSAPPSEAVREFAVVLDDPVTRLLLPAPPDPAACRPISDASEQLYGFFAGLAPDADVVVDVGRLDAGRPPPGLRLADRVLLVLRPTLRAVAAVQPRLVTLADYVERNRLALLVVGDDGPYGVADIQATLGLRCAAVLARDAASAAMLHGERTAGRSLGRGALLRSARVAAQRLAAGTEQQQQPAQDVRALGEVAPVPERVG